MKYSAGYKYKLRDNCYIPVPWSIRTTLMKGPRPDKIIDTFYLKLDPEWGTLVIKKGYAWDGASGPVPDTKHTMKASLVHDAWYQMIREKTVPYHTKEAADAWFGDICVKNGVWGWLANLYVLALGEFGHRSLENGRDIYEI